GGTLTRNQQTHSSAQPFTNTFTATGGEARVSVRVTDIDGADNSPICSQGREVTITNLRCEDLNLYFDGERYNGETLEPGQQVLLSAYPENTDKSAVPRIRWSESGYGFFMPTTQSARNPACLGPLPLGVSRNCQYTYTAPNDENATVRIEAEPNFRNVPDCIAEIPVRERQYDDVCEELILDPPYIRRNSETTDFTASLRFTSRDSYDVTLGWHGTNEGFVSESTTGSSTGIDNIFRRIMEPEIVSSGQVWLEEVDSPLYIDLGDCADRVTIQLQPVICEWLDLYTINGQACFDVDPNYNGEWVYWTIGNDAFIAPDDVECQPVPPLTDVHVWATDICQDGLTTDEPPPEINKYVRSVVPFRRFDTSTTTSAYQDEVLIDYLIEFIPHFTTTATITDPIAYGIEGEIYPTGKYEPGTLLYADSLEVERVLENGDVRTLSHCSETTIQENCWYGDIGHPAGIELVEVNDPIRILYQGEIINSSVNEKKCADEDNPACYEFYRNRAAIQEWHTQYSDNLGPFYSNEAYVYLYCQYILARAAGDVFLERELDFGIDTEVCEVPNITGPPVVPRPPTPPDIVSTGLTESIVTIRHEICAKGQAGDLDESLSYYYGKDIVGNMSSEICEIGLQTGESWRQSVITNTIDENKTRISRWGADFNLSVPLTTVLNRLETQNVVHINNGDLTVGTNLIWNDGKGAKTIIVENGDLIINKNIEYGACLPPSACTVNDIASLAFIVLNGNVYVDPSVETMAGVYFVQEGDDEGTTGNLYSGSPSSNDQQSFVSLKVFGSIYGDIEPLFKNRIFAGDPREEEGGIVIRFDERVILNTPPGLSDILDISSLEVAR
ncbi:hypothetical protein ACFL2V_09630, partial [Pseudomonadota bacterium]